MSVLSPIAAAILNTLQSGSKNDSKSDDAFLSLLESGGGNADASVSYESEQSLVETLYEEKDEPQPVATTVDVPTSVFVDNKYPAKDAARAPEREQNTEQRESVPAAKASETTGSVRKDQPAKEKAEEAPKASAAPKESRPVTGTTKKQATQADNDNVESGDLTSFAEKIRAKIDQLNDILSLLASGLSVNMTAQVSVVQITQTTLTMTQQGMQDGSQPFLDLSDRFDQLIAALSTGGQNLPADIQKGLAASFGEFKSILSSMMDPSAISFSMSTLSVTALTVAPMQARPVILSQLDSLQVSLSNVMQQIQPLEAATVDKSTLADALKLLNQWISDTKTLVQQPMNTEALVQNAVPKDMPVVSAAPLVSAPDAAKTTLAVKHTGDIAIQASGTGAASAAAASASAPVPVQANNVNATANTVIAANAIESAAATAGNSNFSGNGGSGQGGERPATAGVTFGNAAPASTAPTNATNFSKALKAASTGSTPVPEQVAFNIKTAAKSGNSKIEIQLDPIELGKLHIKMNISGDGKATNIVITAENRETLALLQRDARGLENALADAGIKADSGSLSFNLRGGDQQQQDEKRQAFAGYAPVKQEEDEMAPLAVVSRSYVVNTTDGLDIKI